MTLYQIKALEWVDVSDEDGEEWSAQTPFCVYTVAAHQWQCSSSDRDEREFACTSIEDGKAQAEAHWQARAASILEPSMPVVVVRFDEAGGLDYHVAGDVRLFIVDERAPQDRVYEWTPKDTAEEVQTILGDSPIGSSADERHSAIAHTIEAMIDGRPRLAVVSKE